MNSSPLEPVSFSSRSSRLRENPQSPVIHPQCVDSREGAKTRIWQLPCYLAAAAPRKLYLPQSFENFIGSDGVI
jgi:hypothetical protein